MFAYLSLVKSSGESGNPRDTGIEGNASFILLPSLCVSLQKGGMFKILVC